MSLHYPLTHSIVLSPEPWPALSEAGTLLSQNSKNRSRNSSNWAAGLVDAERRGNSELPEETEKGKPSRSQRFRQGALSGAIRKVAVLLEPGWSNMAFFKKWELSSLYIILILLHLFNFAWPKCLIFNVLLFHLKLLFIFIIQFPSQVPLLIKRVVYNPLPWIRLSSNTLFPFWLLIPSHCIIQLFHSIASIIHYFFFSKIDSAEIEHPHFSFLLELLCRNPTRL